MVRLLYNPRLIYKLEISLSLSSIDKLIEDEMLLLHKEGQDDSDLWDIEILNYHRPKKLKLEKKNKK